MHEAEMQMLRQKCGITSMDRIRYAFSANIKVVAVINNESTWFKYLMKMDKSLLTKRVSTIMGGQANRIKLRRGLRNDWICA